MLVGPASNAANLPTDQKLSVKELFALLFQAAVASAGQGDGKEVRFLSRYDKSANNIRESTIWASIGCTPWAEPVSGWYHRYVAFPFQALRAASKLGEYTLVNRGTWYAIEEEVRREMKVFKEAVVENENDELLNPAHALLGARARDDNLGAEFLEWIAKEEGGQSVIKRFEVNGAVLHSPAPNDEKAEMIVKVRGKL